ncbi:PspC domain-containing protein [Nocardioides albertanoniae]|uniref:PspC domain-containing protein n=1 Tax=Nocardioides albertanoniae TaxID=1175486 RepID=UPI001476E26B|nr:PspC domain-containing protein [Nocardioides albertanoniae]
MTIPPAAPPPPTPEPPAPAAEERPRPSGEQLRNLSGLRRTTHASAEGRHIAGVAGGIARHFDVDPLLVRVLLAVSVVFGGAGGIVYAAVWLLVPEDGHEDGVIPVGPPARNLFLWIAGGVAAISLLSDAFGDTGVPWFWLAVVAVIALWYARRDKRDRRRGAAPAAASAPVGDPTGHPSSHPSNHPAAAQRTSYLPAPWAPGSYDPHVSLAPPNRRRRPPLLFGRAVAVAALVMGVLGLLDVLDRVPVPNSAYPAALLVVFGGFLVLGAFWGRAGGLIFLGLIALVALPLTTVDPSTLETGSSIEAHPRSVAALESSYEFGVGAIVLDTSAIDPKTFEGRDLAITSSFGEITVIVPDDATVSVEAKVGALGEAQIFDEKRTDLGGFTMERSRVAGEEGSRPGLADAADLRLTATSDVGAINVYTESDPRAARFTDSTEVVTP